MGHEQGKQMLSLRFFFLNEAHLYFWTTPARHHMIQGRFKEMYWLFRFKRLTTYWFLIYTVYIYYVLMLTFSLFPNFLPTIVQQHSRFMLRHSNCSSASQWTSCLSGDLYLDFSVPSLMLQSLHHPDLPEDQEQLALPGLDGEKSVGAFQSRKVLPTHWKSSEPTWSAQLGKFWTNVIFRRTCSSQPLRQPPCFNAALEVS